MCQKRKEKKTTQSHCRTRAHDGLNQPPRSSRRHLSSTTTPQGGHDAKSHHRSARRPRFSPVPWQSGGSMMASSRGRRHPRAPPQPASKRKVFARIRIHTNETSKPEPRRGPDHPIQIWATPPQPEEHEPGSPVARPLVNPHNQAAQPPPPPWSLPSEAATPTSDVDPHIDATTCRHHQSEWEASTLPPVPRDTTTTENGEKEAKAGAPAAQQRSPMH